MFEDLNVKAMQKFDGSMVADNVMGLITQLSKYKAEREDKLYHEIGRFEKSTGICTECRQRHVLTLNDRDFTCSACNAYQNRDLSAAGIVARVIPISQQKSAIKTKVFELSKLVEGTEKKEAA